jgi:hypothetical protein
MKIAYVEPKNWNKRTREFLAKVTAVCDDYHAQGYKLTLRQLYYQLVSSEFIPNQQSEYKRLSIFLTQARMAGLVDWDIIEDRIRIPRREPHWDGIKNLVEAAVSGYRRDRWEDQDNFCEVWVEKDALSGVLYPIAEEFHVSLLVNRGYSSASCMHESAIRLRRQEDFGKKVTVLYLGDHDPSGEDMVRDIESRLRIFGCKARVKKIALTMKQIEQYNPPPNPAKLSDPRSTDYINKHGESSWELDALKPDVLNKLLRKEIGKIIDIDRYNDVIELEKNEVRELEEATSDL